MFNNHIREHKHRLNRSIYTGRIICAFTICVLNKDDLFVSEPIYDSIRQILLKSLKENDCAAHIYLFMPNHCHLLIEGKLKNSDLWRCIVNFKQYSGYWLSQHQYKEKWQKDFYDHVLRKDEDIIQQVKYILRNPLRKNLVYNWKDYPFKGSTIYDFNRWSDL